MSSSVLQQIQRLEKMTVAELREEWQRLHDEPTRSRNKQFLFRRLAWQLQQQAEGGLSEHAKARIKELASDGFTRARTPVEATPDDVPPPSSRPARMRDIRMPSIGSVISRRYKGRDLRVVVREDGFEYDGTMYGSLTALARAITGSKNINGKLFFGITERKR